MCWNHHENPHDFRSLTFGKKIQTHWGGGKEWRENGTKIERGKEGGLVGKYIKRGRMAERERYRERIVERDR